jgi:hypothetical protein
MDVWEPRQPSTQQLFLVSAPSLHCELGIGPYFGCLARCYLELTRLPLAHRVPYRRGAGTGRQRFKGLEGALASVDQRPLLPRAGT